MLELPLPPVFWLNLFGATLAGVMGLPLCLGRTDRPRQRAGGLLMLLAVASAAITLEHAAVGLAGRLFEAIEIVTGLLVGPLLLALVRSAVGRGALARPWLHAVPAALAALWLAAVLLGWIDRGVPIRLVIAHQIAYTTTAIVVYQRARRKEAVWAVFLAIFLVVHAAQLARLVLARWGLLREIVPTTLTVAVVALAGLAVWAVSGGTRLPRRARYRKSGLDEEEAAAILARLDTVLEEERPFTDPALDLTTLAEAIGEPPHRLSQLLNQYRGESFHELVARRRVEEAQRLLADPDNEILTIEAIGRRAGFSSRSTFYDAFRRETGTTPARFRDER